MKSVIEAIRCIIQSINSGRTAHATSIVLFICLSGSFFLSIFPFQFEFFRKKLFKIIFRLLFHSAARNQPSFTGKIVFLVLIWLNHLKLLRIQFDRSELLSKFRDSAWVAYSSIIYQVWRQI